ncbi:hypothetical protein O0L34_g12955 [Tuta absoluta]|nr:hypothetical protein O0L34_g12955 [Tuta absoluta]
MSMTLEELYTKLSDKIDEKFERQTAIISAEVTNNVTQALNVQINALKVENEVLNTKMSKLEEKVDFMEREKRKCNLLFFGLEENGKSEVELVDYIKETILETGTHIDSQEIQNVSRIGRYAPNKNRPIAVSFTTLWKKHIIQRNKSNLPQGIYIKEDYSKEVLEKRKNLQLQLAEERKKGNRAYIRYDKLVVKSAKDNTRDKRKREESGSPNLSTSSKKEMDPTIPTDAAPISAENTLTTTTPDNRQPTKKNKIDAHVLMRSSTKQ